MYVNLKITRYHVRGEGGGADEMDTTIMFLLLYAIKEFSAIEKGDYFLERTFSPTPHFSLCHFLHLMLLYIIF